MTARVYVRSMGITRRATEPATVTNTSGQPEIVLEIDGLTLQMAPPSVTGANRTDQPASTDEADADTGTDR